ncbi:MAG: sigma-54 dependent transcriptional regulator [Polyangiaceae bacterium]
MTTVLTVDDEPAVRFTLREVLEDRGYNVVEASGAREALRIVEQADVVITDLAMPEVDGFELLAELAKVAPEVPVMVLTARGSERAAVRALKSGAFDYLVKPFDVDELTHAVARAAETGSLRLRRTQATADALSTRGIVGESRALMKVVNAAIRVASKDVPVLVTGETGTGKELLASLLHSAGARSRGPLVRFNCAAIPRDLAESELFGHAAGAFTGATRAQRGLFARAHGGTLVLDEIGELPLELQPKLLRAVERHEIAPLGSDRELEVDVRIVASTHRDLRALVASGAFRQDLYYRLSVVELRMPSLAERREDIPMLARALAARAAERFGLERVSLSAELVDALATRPWPGNVRELENTVARLVALAESDVLEVDLLDEGVEKTRERTPDARRPLRAQLEEFEKRVIVETLADTGKNHSESARRLGISRATLIDRIRRYGL